MTASPTTQNTWRKSTHSQSGSDCIEIAGTGTGALLVRDSKAPDGGVLRFGAREWRAFIADVKGGAA